MSYSRLFLQIKIVPYQCVACVRMWVSVRARWAYIYCEPDDRCSVDGYKSLQRWKHSDNVTTANMKYETGLAVAEIHSASQPTPALFEVFLHE